MKTYFHSKFSDLAVALKNENKKDVLKILGEIGKQLDQAFAKIEEKTPPSA